MLTADACINFAYHFPKMQHFRMIQSFPSHVTIKQTLNARTMLRNKHLTLPKESKSQRKTNNH